jgi:hypothetical protein
LLGGSDMARMTAGGFLVAAQFFGAQHLTELQA